MFAQSFGETPDFVERVIKRRRRCADDVWFAKIAFSALPLFLLDRSQYFLKARMTSERVEIRVMLDPSMS
jgi:hypothetical protein